MEDSNSVIISVTLIIAHAIRDKLGNDSNCGLFAIFDGHGGK